MKILRFFWRLIRHPIYLFIILGLLISNTAVMFSSTVARAISGLVGSIGVETVFAWNTNEISRQKTKIQKQSAKISRQANVISRQGTRIQKQSTKFLNQKAIIAKHTGRISKRVTFGASRNVATTFGEGIPFYGIAIISGVTALEIVDACATMEDMKEINKAFDTNVNVQGDDYEFCGLEVPSKDKIESAVYKSPRIAWNNFLKKTEGIELPDFEINPSDLLDFDWPDIDLRNLFSLDIWPFSPPDGSEQGADTQSDGN